MKKIEYEVRKLTVFLCIAVMLIMILPAGNTVEAATKVGKTSRIHCTWSDIYRKSAQKYCPDNIGDVDSYELEWKEVLNADGYKVLLSWESDEGKFKETMIVKKKGNKYLAKILNKSGNTSIYSSGKNCALSKGGFGTITMKKPYCILCTGTCVGLEKVSIQAYRTVNGKRVYGKTVTKKM